MLEKSISWLIYFGTSQRYLQDATSRYKIKGDGLVLDNIDRFVGQIDELGFTVTRRAARPLAELREELEKSTEQRLTEKQAERLKKVMQELRPTLVAEGGGTIAYIISERRYPIEKLLDDPGSLFAEEVFTKLPQLAQYDFGEAAKCLAFERPTAAAFHMLRGTESTLRDFYCQKIKKNRSELMWGPMIQSMRVKAERFPQVLLNHLDNIRASFRNPTAHPEKTYDLDEVRTSLDLIDVANRMVHGLT